ncbi:hypothetical protein MMC14_003776 [Varicellaria rhodocarpa]|nr:hypothetical protein [Varicellaria rhodocarpa]
MIYFNLLTPGDCGEDEICVDGIVGQGGAVPGPVASCVKMEDLIKYVGLAGKWIRQGGGQGEAQGEGSGTIVSTLSALLPTSISPATSQKYSITALLTTSSNQTLLSASNFAIHPQQQVKTGANNMAWYDLPIISPRSHSLPLGTINNNITKTTTNHPTIIPNNVFTPRNAPPPPPPPNPKDALPLPSTPQTCTACAEVRLTSIPPGTQRISVDVQLPVGVESGVVWMIGGGG